jgi:hypothetical protein
MSTSKSNKVRSPGITKMFSPLKERNTRQAKEILDNEAAKRTTSTFPTYFYVQQQGIIQGPRDSSPTLSRSFLTHSLNTYQEPTMCQVLGIQMPSWSLLSIWGDKNQTEKQIYIYTIWHKHNKCYKEE